MQATKHESQVQAHTTGVHLHSCRCCSAQQVEQFWLDGASAGALPALQHLPLRVSSVHEFSAFLMQNMKHGKSGGPPLARDAAAHSRSHELSMGLMDIPSICWAILGHSASALFSSTLIQ